MPQMRWRALGWSAVVFAIAFRDVVPRAKHAGSMQLLFAEAFPMTSMSSARRSRIMCATYSKNVDDDVGVDAIASAPPTPIIDQEGRQWRSSAQLASQNLVRDGLSDLEVLAADNESLQSPPTPFTLRQHSLLLRGAEEKGRFVNDDERWSYRYDALCKFQERYGHTCVPFNWGMLVDKRHTAGDVPKSDGLDYDNGEEPALLSATSGENSFDDERKRSNESKRSRDNIQLSSEFAEPYLRLELGYWVAQQRKYYKQRIRGDIVAGQRLTPERIEYLNKLDFIWDVKEARWETQYMQLREFVQNNGHACVNQNSTLGQWCYRQRQHRRNIDNGLTVDWASIPERAYMPILLNETQDVSMILAEDRVVETAAGGKEYKGRPVSPLTPERMERLEALGFIWDVREQGKTLKVETLFNASSCMSEFCPKLTTLHFLYVKSLGRPIPISEAISAEARCDESAAKWQAWRLGQKAKRSMAKSAEIWRLISRYGYLCAHARKNSET